MACHHYLTQWWLLINHTRNRIQWKKWSTLTKLILFDEIARKVIVCNFAAIFVQGEICDLCEGPRFKSTQNLAKNLGDMSYALLLSCSCAQNFWASTHEKQLAKICHSYLKQWPYHEHKPLIICQFWHLHFQLGAIIGQANNNGQHFADILNRPQWIKISLKNKILLTS